MVRGLILGLGWGVLASVTGAATLSLIYSDANKTAVVSDPKTAPTMQDSPEMQEGETESDNAATVAPETLQDQAPSSDEPTASAEPTESTESTVQTPANETPSQATDPAQEGIAPVETGSAENAPSPEIQEGPVADETPRIEMTPDVVVPDTDAPDTDVAGLPKTVAPDPVVPPSPPRKLPEISATPDVPTKDAPTDIPTDAEAESRFDQARVTVPKMQNRAPNVRTNRLPSIGGDTAQKAPQEASETETVAEPDQGALTLYSMPFENPDAKPMYSLVLIDDPEHPVSSEMLAHLPFAVSFAIDALRDDATEVAAKYRGAGFEVVMLTNLPSGATAADVEVAFEAYSHAIPEAVAVLDLGANGFLRGPSTATQIAGIMSEAGYGLITPSKGLNSAQKAAKREGVPAALLFRELDFDGENVSLIRRYLDRAAFRASQEGSVIMLGHTRPKTIEALVTWTLDDRAASVAIAPVSAVLLAQ